MKKNTLKSIGAVLAGFITVVILSTGTDFILETLGMFPPLTEPQSYTWLMLLFALIYRSMYTVAGTIGVVVAWKLSPQHWYPISLVITALPCTWLGGKLKTK